MLTNDRYEILTTDGYKDFETVSKSIKELVKISTTNFTTIVSTNHPFDVMGEIFNSSELEPGMLLDTTNGLEEVTFVEHLGVSDEVYDVINVEKTMNYIGDGIVQHNCFYGSTYTLIEVENLVRKKEKLGIMHEGNRPNLYPIRDFNIKIFKPPEDGRCYVCGVDVADGVGANESIISIFDITNPIEKVEQVASFASNKISTTELAYLIAKICNIYNSPPVLIEANNMGSTVIKFLFMIYEYENIAKIDMKKGRGIFSHNKLKIEACLNFKLYIDNPDLNTILYEPILYTQLEWFQRKDYGNGQHTYVAEKQKLDDHVLAAVWALFILDPKYLAYFFDFTLETIGLEQIPTNLRSFTSNIIDTTERDKFLDKTYKEIENKEIGNDHVDTSSISSVDSIKEEKPLERGKSTTTPEDLFFSNLGFKQI